MVIKGDSFEEVCQTLRALKKAFTINNVRFPNIFVFGRRNSFVRFVPNNQNRSSKTLDKGDNDIIVEYDGKKCTAIYNIFAGYYVDDIYGVIED